MRKVELIIFDLDGTLVDSKNDIAQAVNITLRELGLEEIGEEEIYSFVGSGMEDLIKKTLGEKQDLFLERALSIFKEYYSRHVAENSVLYPGVREILEHFKGKKKIIITNRIYEFAVSSLKALGIDGYFEDVIGADDVECMKPSACPLDKVRNKFKMAKEKAIIVGDMDIDVLAGKRAGILTCAVTYGIGKKEDILRANPDYIIDDISQLKGVVS